MARLKPFYPGRNYEVHTGQNNEIRTLLGLPEHRRYVRGLIVASTKAAAVALVNDLRASGQPLAWVQPSDLRMVPDLPLSRDLEAAGLFAEPAVFLTGEDTSNGPVVRIKADGVQVVGQMVDAYGSPYRNEFEPTGTLRLKLLPGPAAAVRELLAMVDYDDPRARELRAQVPAELLDGGAT